MGPAQSMTTKLKSVPEAVSEAAAPAATEAAPLKRARVLAEMFGDANYHADRLARAAGY